MNKKTIGAKGIIIALLSFAIVLFVLPDLFRLLQYLEFIEKYSAKYSNVLLNHFIQLVLLAGAGVVLGLGYLNVQKRILTMVGMGLFSITAVLDFALAIEYEWYSTGGYWFRNDIAYKGFAFLTCLLFMLAGVVGFVVVLLRNLHDDEAKKSTTDKFWFSVPILYAVSIIIWFVLSFGEKLDWTGETWAYGEHYCNILTVLLMAIEVLVCFKPFENIHALEGTSVAVSNMAQKENISAASAGSSAWSGYCSMTKHVFLLLFTFGVWHLIWVYRVTETLNGSKVYTYRNPIAKLLLYMFVPFYSIYWMYQTGLRVDQSAHDAGGYSKLATLSLILTIFMPIIPIILLQSKMNDICAMRARAEGNK